MDALINIGLIRNDALGYVKVRDIESLFRDFNVVEYASRVAVAGDGEPGEDTFIAHVGNVDQAKLYVISQALKQDCIACYDLSKCQGALVGPKAETWGVFNPSMFQIL